MTGRRVRRAAVAVAVASVVVVVAVAVAGCGGDGRRDDLAADTARFSYGERSVVVPLDECARDGDVVLAVGRRDATVLQVAADLGEGGAGRSGVTADLGDDGIWGAFGPEVDPAAPDPGGGPGGDAAADTAPGAGEITAVTVDGDVLTVEGRWASLDGDLRAQPGQPLLEGRLQARCPGTASAVA